jgi:hypothetical protein
MGTLTKNERDGLEEVFMSIHSHSNKYQNLKELSTLIMSRRVRFSVSTFVKQVKYGVKETNLSHFLSYISKKKKYLSK